jgi:hypothetical protein
VLCGQRSLGAVDPAGHGPGLFVVQIGKGISQALSAINEEKVNSQLVYPVIGDD